MSEERLFHIGDVLQVYFGSVLSILSKEELGELPEGVNLAGGYKDSWICRNEYREGYWDSSLTDYRRCDERIKDLSWWVAAHEHEKIQQLLEFQYPWLESIKQSDQLIDAKTRWREYVFAHLVDEFWSFVVEAEYACTKGESTIGDLYIALKEASKQWANDVAAEQGITWLPIKGYDPSLNLDSSVQAQSAEVGESKTPQGPQL